MNQEDVSASAVIAGQPPMTDIERIKQMPHIEMCRMVRFAPIGHLYFKSGSPECRAFMERYEQLGGMTPEISKLIGH